MDAEQKRLIAQEILRGVPSSGKLDGERLFRARLRGLGDEIGELILSDEKDAPAHYVRVEVPLLGEAVTVAMAPRAAEAILNRI